MMVSWGNIEEDLSNSPLKQLEDKLLEIQYRQNQIASWGLSDETVSAVIKEFQEQKKSVISLMHQKVDEL